MGQGNTEHDPELERQLDQLRRDAQTSEDDTIEPELAHIKDDIDKPEVTDLETVDMLKSSSEIIKDMVQESKQLEVEVVHTREQSKEKEIDTQQKRQEKEEAVKEGLWSNSLRALQVTQ